MPDSLLTLLESLTLAMDVPSDAGDPQKLMQKEQ